MIWLNRIMCNKCGDIITSENRHDYKSCKCGNCAVDGGFTYRRIIGEDWTDMSIVTEEAWEKYARELSTKCFDNYIAKEKEISVDVEQLQEILRKLDDFALATAYYKYHCIKLQGVDKKKRKK